MTGLLIKYCCSNFLCRCYTIVTDLVHGSMTLRSRLLQCTKSELLIIKVNQISTSTKVSDDEANVTRIITITNYLLQLVRVTRVRVRVRVRLRIPSKKLIFQ